MYLLLIRPQQRRVRQHQALVASLAVGDEVVTAGGILGTITGVSDEYVSLEVAPATVVQVLRGSVSRRVSGEYEADQGSGDEIDAIDAPGEVDAGTNGTAAGGAGPATPVDDAATPRPGDAGEPRPGQVS